MRDGFGVADGIVRGAGTWTAGGGRDAAADRYDVDDVDASYYRCW
jgi:hypothetical protein